MNEKREGLGRTVLVTGASAGIGGALAREFARHGFNLVLTARRAERLTELADELRRSFAVGARTLPADLANPQTCKQLTEALEREGIAIDALVNNAGFAIANLYRDSPWEAQRDFIQVMVTAPCELTHHLLPGMICRNYGRILNVASVAGLMPGSVSHTLYGGAKAMLIKFSQSLHSEQKGTGIHVSALCPGFTRSEFHDVTGTRESMERLPNFLWLSAEFVAREGYRAVMANKAVCIPGAQYKLITALVRMLPIGLAHRLGEVRSRIEGK